MARRSARDNAPKPEEDISSSAQSDDDVKENDEGSGAEREGQIEILTGDFPDPPDSSGSQPESGDSQQLASIQLLQEQRHSSEQPPQGSPAGIRTSSKTKLPSTSSQQTEPQAAESVGFLNAVSKTTESTTRTSTVTATQTSPQSSMPKGKLKPIKRQINAGGPKRKRDEYDMIESPQKPPPSAQPQRTQGSAQSTPSKHRIVHRDGKERMEKSPKSAQKRQVEHEPSGDEHVEKAPKRRQTTRGTRQAVEDVAAPADSNLPPRRSTRATRRTGEADLGQVEWSKRPERSITARQQVTEATEQEGPSNAVATRRGRGRPQKVQPDEADAPPTIKETRSKIKPARDSRKRADRLGGQPPKTDAPSSPQAVPANEAPAADEQSIITNGESAGAERVEQRVQKKHAAASKEKGMRAQNGELQGEPEDDDDEVVAAEEGSPASEHEKNDEGMFDNVENGRDEQHEADERAEHEPHFDRLFGQKKVLDKIYDALNKIGVRRTEAGEKRLKINLSTSICRAVTNCSTKARKLFQELEKKEILEHEDVDAVDDALTRVRESLEAFDGAELDDQSENNRAIVQEVYGRVIPALIRLIRAAVSFYDQRDAHRRDKGQLGDQALIILSKMMRWVGSLEEKARNWKARPDPHVPVVRVIKSQIVVPLRAVERTFKNELDKREQLKRKTEERAALEEELRKREEEEAEKRRDGEKEKARKLLWMALHAVRMVVEPDVRHQRHLQARNIEPESPEKDANGQPYERVELFAHRDGSSRPKNHGTEPWNDDELEALVNGLQEFAVENTLDKFRCIFQEYCGPGGILRPYNVTEITQMAAHVRDSLLQLATSQGYEPELWVINIPDLH